MKWDAFGLLVKVALTFKLKYVLANVWPHGYWFVHMSAANIDVPNLCTKEIGLRVEK